MSHEGKLTRGWKWYQFRDLDGVLPEEIQGDPNKMVDVDYYLDFIKGEDVKQINKKLSRLRYAERNNVKGRMKIIADIKAELRGMKEEQEKKKKEKKEKEAKSKEVK